MRGRMMNVLALCLIFTSLATAGFFTPNPDLKDDVAVKEGHRAVVVEFEKDDGNTKVSISPQDDAQTDDQKGHVANAKEKLSEKMEEAKEKIKEASASVLPDHVRKEGISSNQEEETHQGFRTRELVCDAYGKCKHKIASAMEKTKAAVAAKAHELEEEAKETVSEAIGKVKDTVTHTAHKASDKAQEMKDSVKDAASDVSSKAKDKVVDKSSEMKEEAIRKMEGAKEGGKRSLKGIFRRGGGVPRYLVLPATKGLVGGVLHLLGFAAAYGMGLWVTFASSYVLARELPRQQFAMVQSKIYPVYFKAMASGVGVALLGHLMGLKRLSPLSMGLLQEFNLLGALVMILVNLMYLEPRATKVMFERMKKEKEEGQATEAGGRVVDSASEAPVVGTATGGTAQEKQEEAAAAKPQVTRPSEDLLRRLNSYSSFLNVATLMSLTWHLVHLGQKIRSVC